MRVRGLIALLIVLGVLGGGVYFARQRLRAASAPAQPVYATARVQRGTLVADVTGFGPLNAQFQNPLNAPASGTVQKVFVQQGDTVHPGEVLAILSNPTLVNTVRSDRVKLQQDLTSLANALGVSPGQAEAAASTAQIPVRAPQTGQLETLKATLGDNLNAGDEIAQIVDNAQVIMDLPLVPYDAHRVAVGDKVSVHFNQFAGTVVGAITQLSSNPVPAGQGGSSAGAGAPAGSSGGGAGAGRLVYPCVVTLPNPGLLAPGQSGQVTILTPAGALVDPQPGTISRFGTSTVVNSPLAGSVTSLNVSQGAHVTKGEVLLTLGGPSAANSVAALEAQVASDRTQLQQDQQTEANLVIKSHLNGTVGFLNLQPGQRVGSGNYLGVVFNNSSMNLTIQVDELQVANVHAGQAVRITTPGLPGRVFGGKVLSVNTMGQNLNGLATFSVQINVSGTAALKPGMTANADIVVATARHALIVPVEAVLQKGSQAVVEVLRHGRPAVVPVQVGLVNSSEAQITKGLSVGETVITGMAGQSLPALSASPGVTTAHPPQAGGVRAGGGSRPALALGHAARLPASKQG